jgi:hypothetical protein
MSDEIFSIRCVCGKSMKVRESSVGKKVRCPDCQVVTTIEHPPAPLALAPVEEISQPSIPKIVVADPKKPSAKSATPAVVSQSVESIEVLAKPKSGAEKRKPTPAEPSPGSKTPDFSAFEIETQPSAQPLIQTVAASTVAGTSLATETAKPTTFAIVSENAQPNPISAAKSDTASNPAESGRRYPTLELVRKIYKVMGYVTLVVGIILFAITLYGAFQAGTQSLVVSLPGIFFALCGTLIGPITMFAAAEFIKLMIDIQDNTHRGSRRD